jgi:mRNA interferase RelE/StbE
MTAKRAPSPTVPRYRVEVAPAAERDLRKLDPHVRKRVIEDLLRLEEDPRPQAVSRLELKEKLYRIRVGPGKNYRAIYPIQDKKLIVLVLKVGDRKEVYRRVE